MPRGWNIKKLLRLDSKTQDAGNVPEKHEAAKASKSSGDGKLKRKAPPIPAACESSDKIPAGVGISGTGDGQSERKSNGLNQSSSSSTTWSTSSSPEYSPSSNSFSSSSLSDSTLPARKPELIIQRVGPKDEANGLRGEDPQNRSAVAGASVNDSAQNAENCAQAPLAESENADLDVALAAASATEQAKIGEGPNCSSLSDYVENAILVSSNPNLLSPSPSKSDEGTAQPPPPRLLSIESSSNLHQDGALKVAPEATTGVKLDYVSLDFVRSAAAEGRSRRKNKDDDDDGASARSNSSLSSSIISSIDSEDGSTIGSDVVENLYNKITSAVARHSSKSSLGAGQPTGDIEKDVYPLIFPGRRRNSADAVSANPPAGNFDFIRPPSQSVASPAEKVESFLRQSLNNNNNNSQCVSDANGVTDLTDLHSGQEYQICEQCSRVQCDSEDEMNEAIHKARGILGRCFCKSGEEHITEIDYCNSNLKEVPPDIWEYALSLTKLLMESNTITELPKELFTCQNLQYLSVSDNDIGLLPPSLASLVNLQHLDVSKNVIEDVPECIRCCKNLQVLDASVNPVERLSEGFTQLISLRELYMNDCFFDFLPANFGRMSQLVVLELRDNQLQILPKSMRRLTQLSRLDLGGNVFQEWPDVIGELRNLTELWLDCNELSKVPPAIGSLTKLTYLDLSRNYLETFPTQIGSLDKLKDLLLSENSLVAVPDTIGFLKELTICNLESNQLTTVPETFGKLVSLEELDLSHNKLEHLPSTVGQLRSLQTLLLDDNKLDELPPEVGSCLALKILQISRNQIEQLPESIGNLTDLRVLNLTQNKLPYLPISMIKLARLNALWITPNQSKPNVPLHAELHQESGQRILTNILFPQKDKAFTQPSKLLSILDDDDSYANDAADDDDPVQYAQRPRGQTHVVFNMDATTYSTDAMHMAENRVDRDVEAENAAEDPPEHQRQLQALSDPPLRKDQDAKPPQKHSAAMDDFSVIVSDNFKPTGLSVLAPSGDESDKPTMKTANILKVKPSAEVAPLPKVDLKEQEGKLRSLTSGQADDLSADEDNLPPVSPQGIRAWTSHSHLPALSTLRANEARSSAQADLKGGSVVEELATADDRKGVFEKRADESTESFSNATSLLDRLEQLANRGREGAQDRATAGARTMLPDVPAPTEFHASPGTAVIANRGGDGHSADAREAEGSEFQASAAALDSIPFMDAPEEDAKESGDRKVAATDEVNALSDRKAAEGSRVAKQDSSNSYALTAEYATEGKSSSVTSGESLPATDHDSGVGNDVESQESIPEEPNDIGGVVHVKPGKAPTYEAKTTQVNESTALRRNKGGWIALVRTDPPSSDASAPANDVFVGATAASPTTQRPSGGEAKRANQLHFAPNVTVDSTTVTYSFDYNNARQQAPKVKDSGNANKVTENIKKFEKFFEGGYPVPRRSSADLSAMRTSKSLNQLPEAAAAPVAAQNAAKKPPPPTKPKNLSQPKATPPSASEPPPSLKKAQPESKETYAQDTPAVPRPEEPSLVDEMTEVDRTLEQLSLRRQAGNQRKSKFEEALAATKHKHFRDKLEKMMQQKAPLTPGRRPSRSSSSPLAYIPRITSPVPMALSPHGKSTPLENLTADDTWVGNEQRGAMSPAERASQQSVHERLKEKLQPKSADMTNASQSRSRQSTSSSKPFGRRGSAIRSSIRSLGGGELEDKEDPEAKQSLEEQLGQLLLDGQASAGARHEQGFVPYVPGDDVSRAPRMQSPPPVSRSVGAFGPAMRKPPPPSDWKDQLLRHIERKKQEKYEINAVHSHLHQQPMRVTSPSRQLDTGYTASASSASSSAQGDSNHAKPESKSFPRNSEARRSFNRPSDLARKPEGQSRAMTRSVTAPEAVGSIPHSAGARRDSLPQPSNFVRSSGETSRQPAGRRSSGRFLRTRTPGPETVPGASKHVDGIVRPKSAMDMPTSSFQMPNYAKQVETASEPKMQKPRAVPAAAPPTYEAHMLRRKAPNGGAHQRGYENDYVNVEYVDQMRAGSRRKDKREKGDYVEQDAYPLRASGSHESVLNSKMEKANAYEAAMPTQAPMRVANSQDSVLDNNKAHPKLHTLYHQPQQQQQNYHGRQQPQSLPGHYSRRDNAVTPLSRAPYPYEPINYQPPRQTQAKQPHREKHGSQYGFIPAPSKTRPPKVPPRDHPMHTSRSRRQQAHDDYMHLPDRRYPADAYFVPPPPPPAFHDDYQETMPPLSPSLQRSYGEREDESVASAFRPYHQHQMNQRQPPAAPTRKHDPYQPHYPHQQQQQYDGRYHQQQQRASVAEHHHHQRRHHQHHDRVADLQYRYHDQQMAYNPAMEEEQSAGSEHSLTGELSRHWREPEAAAELVTVTVMKNPTFGFHIMGGINAGGNPYRPDDDGVFITFVAPGGAADGQVQPGDKILLVNGSDFVGITHKRAVDLLRNAGQVAVLVVERLVGRAV